MSGADLLTWEGLRQNVSDVELTKGQTRALTLDAHAETLIRVSKGCLWVTIEGDPLDYVATCNEPLVLRGGGLVVMEGIELQNIVTAI